MKGPVDRPDRLQIRKRFQLPVSSSLPMLYVDKALMEWYNDDSVSGVLGTLQERCIDVEPQQQGYMVACAIARPAFQLNTLPTNPGQLVYEKYRRNIWRLLKIRVQKPIG